MKSLPKLILDGYIVVPDSDLELVKVELPIHMELTRGEPGCLVFRVEQCRENINRFNVYEEFDSEASFEKHQIRIKQSRWGIVTQGVQRHYNINIE